VRFWDSSALVPLIVEERSSDTAGRLLTEDPELVAWWATPVECASTLGRRERAGAMDAKAVSRALSRLAQLASSWTEILPSEGLRESALRLVRVHDLPAGDALQLAAALVACENRPDTLDLVTLDDRLALAATREGFLALPG
jgi:uncharacterized protein